MRPRFAEALEPYGFDPYAVDAQGRNGFTFVAGMDFEREGPRRFAECLASRSVTVKPSVQWLDPLGTVLMRLRHFPWSTGGIRFAQFLIDHGAPVEPSHRQLAKAISKANADTYQRLVNAAPELAS